MKSTGMAKRAAAVLLATTALVAGAAQATIVKQLTLGEMSKRADLIVRGQVVRKSASWNPEHTRIYTVSEIRVDESLKGGLAAGTVVPVRQLGGELDGLVQSVAGNATFQPDEEVIVFLDKDDTLPWSYVIGMAQGKYTVSHAGGADAVVRDLHDLALVRPGPAGILGAPIEPSAAVVLPPSLETFNADVRAALQTP